MFAQREMSHDSINLLILKIGNELTGDSDAKVFNSVEAKKILTNNPTRDTIRKTLIHFTNNNYQKDTLAFNGKTKLQNALDNIISYIKFDKNIDIMSNSSSNSSDSQLNTIFNNDEKQKRLFKECKKNYGLTINDIKPTGKRKNKPYTLKDIQKACSEKKKQTKQTKKNKKPLEVPPASKSKSSRIDIQNDPRTVVYLSNPTQKKENASRNTSNNYKKMEIKEFKKWFIETVEDDIDAMGFEFKNVSYKIINPNTLAVLFDAPTTLDDTLDAILNYIDTDHTRTVRFDRTKKL